MPSRIFSRFKYAEEFAHDLDSDGYTWVLRRGPDDIEYEDGEEYVNPTYMVEWDEE